MNPSDEQQELTNDDELEMQRSIVRDSLDEIASEVGAALREASLNFPVGLATPNSGTAIVTIMTPHDPCDDDWSHVAAIACQIISKRLGDIRLRSRHLLCAMANAQINAASTTPNAIEFDTRP